MSTNCEEYGYTSHPPRIIVALPIDSRRTPLIVVTPLGILTHLTDVYLMACLIGVHLVGVHLMDMHLIGVHLIGMHLTGMHLTDVHLTGVYLMGVNFTLATRRRIGF